MMFSSLMAAEKCARSVCARDVEVVPLDDRLATLHAPSMSGAREIFQDVHSFLVGSKIDPGRH